MNIESIRSYCLAKRGVTEGFPFDEDTLVFKVRDRIFCLMSLDRLPLAINLKCDPALALELRERHDAVQPGYHMNKKHWNTVIIDGRLRGREIRSMIDHSYEMVISRLPRKDRDDLHRNDPA